MRESRSPVARPPRSLPDMSYSVMTDWDLLDVLVTVDGVTWRLGDFWHYCRIESEMYRHG